MDIKLRFQKTNEFLKNSPGIFVFLNLTFPLINFYYQGQGYQMLGSAFLAFIFIYFNISKFFPKISQIKKAYKISILLSSLIISTVIIQIANYYFLENVYVMYIAGILFQVLLYTSVALILNLFYSQEKRRV